MCRAKINVIIKAAYDKSHFQIKQARAKIVILSDRVKAVVIPIMRNLQCLVQQGFSDSLFSLLLTNLEIVQIHIFEPIVR